MVLRTSRLLLRPVQHSDAEVLHHIWCLPEVRQFLWDDKQVEMDTVLNLLEINENLHRDKQYGLWLIYKAWDTREALGFTGLWHFFEEKKPQLLYGLKGDSWKQGFATEAAERIVQYAFRKLDFEDLHAVTDPPNTASIQLLRRLGFSFWKEEKKDELPALFFRKNREYQSSFKKRE
ncbi:MAG: GNAT family N-acetyltransferase [Bacteroidetes bacterium]|nr:GNAT family N-acetyltransferase [Bacteroidota bacterium]